MPTYDYVCGACGHSFEKFQKMSAGPSRKCPKCGEYKLKRLFGAGSGIIFRGTGFYETDYKRRSGFSGKSGGTSSSPAPKKTSGTESGSGATKSDAKSE